VNAGFKLVTSTMIGLAILGVMLFWPAGTFDYWQAWAFIAVLTAATIVPTVYLGRSDPAALRRRMRSGSSPSGVGAG
jgi:hypothetical protein